MLNFFIKKYIVIIIVFMIVLVLKISSIDHTDEILRDREYCENVKNEVHPDFKNLKSYCVK